MAVSMLTIFSFSLILFLFSPPRLSSTDAALLCKTSFCQRDGPPVRFPFRLTNQSSRCSYKPDFELTCNNQNQTILNLQSSGDFIVTSIDYTSQTAIINDRQNCLPKRFLQNFTLRNSPFQVDNSLNFTFLNCSRDYANGTKTSYNYPRGIEEIDCMSGDNYTIMAKPTRFYQTTLSTCRVIWRGLVPVSSQMWMGLAEDVLLRWEEPGCGFCEIRGGDCGFKIDTDSQIGCFNLPTRGARGLPRRAKYGITIGVGIPGLVCVIGLACFLCTRIRHHRRPKPESFTAILIPQPIIFTAGLDGPTIQSYPKTLLGSSRRLPMPNHNICPICLSEYQPKETLRTIPECNHYFHSDCIDQWLRLNATCPLCRTTPSPSPSSSVNSSSLSSSLSLSSSP